MSVLNTESIFPKHLRIQNLIKRKKKRELARRIIAKQELEIAQNKEGFFSNKGKSIYLLKYFE